MEAARVTLSFLNFSGKAFSCSSFGNMLGCGLAIYGFYYIEIYSLYTHFWRRQWHPTPVLLPGKSHGRRSLVGGSPWGRTELDTTEAT